MLWQQDGYREGRSGRRGSTHGSCVILTSKEQQAAKRAAQLKRLAALPEHLRLGVTLPGMRELLKLLPPDAVAQVNAKIPIDKKTGQPKYPENVEVNGYVQQILMAAWEKVDKMAVCERLKKQGSPHVGEATVFVSWFLATTIETLLDALANFLKEKGLREEDTYFWVCDYVIRQTDVKTDLAYLGECVSAVGHTVLLMEPWDAPAPLGRAYCITEVYHTQKSGAQFDVATCPRRRRRRSRRRLLRTSTRSRRSWPRWTCAPPHASRKRIARPSGTSWSRAWASLRATRWSSACCARRWLLRRRRRWRGCRRPSGGRLCCSTSWAGC